MIINKYDILGMKLFPLYLLLMATVSGCQQGELASQERAGTATHSADDASSIIQEKYVDVKGIKTRYFEAGSGEPLVLVHGGDPGGNGAAALTWDLNMEGLAKNFHVVAFDRLGMGFTDNPKSDEDYSIEAILQHGYDFIRTLGLDRIHLVGQSRGAYWVARFTLEHPELVRTLIICNSGTLAPADPEESRRRSEALFGDLPQYEVREARRLRWSRYSYTTDHITDEFLDTLVSTYQLPKYQEAREKLAKLGPLPGLQAQKEDTLKRIKEGELKVPTLLIWGYNDRSAILQNGLKLFDIFAEGNAGSRMYIVNRAGHHHMREYPEEFNGLVTSFIELNR